MLHLMRMNELIPLCIYYRDSSKARASVPFRTTLLDYLLRFVVLSEYFDYLFDLSNIVVQSF